MSRRMYEVLAARVPRVEPYSIDEMFLDMDTGQDAADLARELRHAVRRIARIPTCVGLGPTKTVAKLANAIEGRPGGGMACANCGMSETACGYTSASPLWEGLPRIRGDAPSVPGVCSRPFTAPPYLDAAIDPVTLPLLFKGEDFVRTDLLPAA